MPETLVPVRERILREIKRKFEAVSEGDDGYTLTWNTVKRDDLSDVERDTGPAIAVLDGPERKNDEVGYRRCIMEVATDFSIRVFQGDDPSEALNVVLADVQRVMTEDPHLTISTNPLCQLTIDVREVRNELDTQLAGDRVVSGIAVWEVVYRHQVRDPRKLVGE